MGGVGGICAQALAAITFKFISIQGGLQSSMRLNVTIYLEGLADMVVSNWLMSMVENNPKPTISIFLAP